MFIFVIATIISLPLGFTRICVKPALASSFSKDVGVRRQ